MDCTNASTNGYTKEVKQQKEIRTNVCLHANSRDKGICFLSKNAYVCLQLVLCPFYVNFVVFLSFLEIICLPAGRVDICAI